MTTIRFFGDSHARYFHINPSIRQRWHLDDNTPTLVGKAIDAASVMGFRPGRSTLNTKKKISRNLSHADFLVLSFGQVDLELGYYYRRVVKGENLSRSAFTTMLSKIYLDFVTSLDFPAEKIAIKGVNLTVLADKEFSFNYVKRIVLDQQEEERQILEDRLHKEIATEKAQNSMHLEFNDKIAKKFGTIGAKYFDINSNIARLSSTGEPDPKLGLQQIWHPAINDHHLADNLELRRYHFRAATRVFGFDVIP